MVLAAHRRRGNIHAPRIFDRIRVSHSINSELWGNQFF
jgi:hypothetical protein